MSSYQPGEAPRQPLWDESRAGNSQGGIAIDRSIPAQGQELTGAGRGFQQRGLGEEIKGRLVMEVVVLLLLLVVVVVVVLLVVLLVLVCCHYSPDIP